MADNDDISQQTETAPALARAPMTPERRQRRWDTMYEKLERVYRASGKCSISKSSRADLHNWILEQRVANANNELPADKLLKLDEIHFAWMGQDEKHEEIWNTIFESIKAYKAANGNCLVPSSYCKDLKLYNWVISQRDLNKTGKLPLQRRDRLERIGFCWGVNHKPTETQQAPSVDGPETQPNVSAGAPTCVSLPPSGSQQPPPGWNLQLERLKIYQARYGDCLVPTSYDEELAVWVSWQHYLCKIDKLGEPRYGKLERIGFSPMKRRRSH